MAAREAGIEKLTLLEEPAAAFYSWIANDLARLAEESVRRADGAGVRRRRRHQRLHADPRDARRRPRRFHAHRGGQASAAGRRQPGSDAGLAGGIEARQAAVDSAAQRAAPAVRGGQGEAALRSESEERRDHGARRRIVAGRRHAARPRSCAKKCWNWRSTASCPFCELADKPKEEKRSLFRELGLPYVSDPAVTRHLAAFLEQRGRHARPTRFCSTAASSFRRSARSASPT